MRQRMDFAAWSSRQVVTLRKLGFQVADKTLARVLVELHNLGAFSAGLIVVGALSHMAWLNELGIVVRLRQETARLPSGQPGLELGAPDTFLKSPLASKLPIARGEEPSGLSARIPGVEGLSIEFHTPGNDMIVEVAGVDGQWTARADPNYDYLLTAPESGALLAGGHCIPVLLPQAARLVWHTLFLSNQAHRLPVQASKDRQRSLVLAAAVMEHDPWALLTAWEQAPPAMAASLRPLRATLLASLGPLPELYDLFNDCLRSS
ncbi:MAG: hypothetical protein KGP14_04395 [Betaproteobacteria bacterium]|nr:hypothetical protein [Betaproteobacteria bacterium]